MRYVIPTLASAQEVQLQTAGWLPSGLRPHVRAPAVPFRCVPDSAACACSEFWLRLPPVPSPTDAASRRFDVLRWSADLTRLAGFRLLAGAAQPVRQLRRVSAQDRAVRGQLPGDSLTGLFPHAMQSSVDRPESVANQAKEMVATARFRKSQ